MRSSWKTVPVGLIVFVVCAVAFAADFEWNWRSQETIGRTDPSVGNTSKLTEPQRTVLVDAIAARLQKPMSDQGYDDQRIREIATTTRVRFVDVGGGGKPLLFATSLGLEGGCDSMANCPLWIFRYTKAGGYVSALDAEAASYTVQPTSSNGFSDLVLMRHVSATESHLTLYSYADGKYAEAGCYTATWAPPKDGEVQDPAITECTSEATAQPDKPEAPAKPEAEAPAKPDEPAKADAPAKPDDPAKADAPAKQDDSAQPEVPAQPEAPATPQTSSPN